MEIVEHELGTCYRWSCGPSTFLACPEQGARLMQWRLAENASSEREIIYWPELADCSDLKNVRGGNPILFPFSGRSFDAGEMGYWRDAQGTRRPMPMHGFSSGGAFKVIELSAQGFSAELQPDADAQQAYPYKYRFVVSYEFRERSLRVRLCLHNLDTQPIVWSAGHHFYFRLPGSQQTSRADYRYKIPAAEAFTHAANGQLLPDNAVQPSGSFADAGINDRIFSQLGSSPTWLTCEKTNESLSIRILPGGSAAGKCNAIVLWSESDASPYYCVEPWMGPPNSPEHGQGLHCVPAAQSACFEVEVAAQKLF